jgi:signal transduction histidine kinase
MEESVDRVGTIIRDLLDFARPGTDTESSGDIIAAVHSVVKLIEPQKRMRHVSLRVQTTLAAAPVGMPSNRIEQILINLLFNAADATPASGHVDLNVEAIDQGYAFTVSDEGSGISPDVLERIFDPFYTTKDPGEGTGLGLSICHGLVERYAGTIHVQSEPGAGTCFTIRLPAVQSEIS